MYCMVQKAQELQYGHYPACHKARIIFFFMKQVKQSTKIIVVVAVVILGVLLLLRQKNTSVNSLFPATSITHGHGIAVDRVDANKLYIATHHGLMALINEKDLYLVGRGIDDYMGFSLHPTESNVLFSSGHPSVGGNIGFQRSDDSGVTWKNLSNGIGGPVDFHAMAVSPVNPDIIYGWYQGNLQRSIDGGKNWEIINKDIFAVQLAADSQDERTLYAATPDGRGVLVSRNGGVDFTSLSSTLEGGQVSVIAVHPADAKQLFVFSEMLGGLGESIDGGVIWRKIPEIFDGETILYITFQSQNPTIVYALTHKNSIYKSTDTGETWSKIR